jgi:hypothetical protein
VALGFLRQPSWACYSLIWILMVQHKNIQTRIVCNLIHCLLLAEVTNHVTSVQSKLLVSIYRLLHISGGGYHIYSSCRTGKSKAPEGKCSRYNTSQATHVVTYWLLLESRPDNNYFVEKGICLLNFVSRTFFFWVSVYYVRICQPRTKKSISIWIKMVSKSLVMVMYAHACFNFQTEFRG